MAAPVPNDNNEIYECTICLTNIFTKPVKDAGIAQGRIVNNLTYAEKDAPIIMKCNHVFHRGCIYPWLAENDKCPNCREKIINRVEEIVYHPRAGGSFRARILRNGGHNGQSTLPGFQLLNNLKRICRENFYENNNFLIKATNYLATKALAIITIPTNILSLFLSTIGLLVTAGQVDYIQEKTAGSLGYLIKSIADLVWLNEWENFPVFSDM